MLATHRSAMASPASKQAPLFGSHLQMRVTQGFQVDWRAGIGHSGETSSAAWYVDLTQVDQLQSCHQNKAEKMSRVMSPGCHVVEVSVRGNDSTVSTG